MKQPPPERPTGVVLSAVALGLATLVLLLLSFGGFVTALAGPGVVAASAPTPGLPPGFLRAVMLGMTLLYLALAAWAVSTLLGLLRMRPWARVSSMIIAGCLAGLGLLSAVSMLGLQSAVASGAIPIPPNVPPGAFHKIFLGITLVSLVVAGLGIVWLVYLAQRRTREAFARAQRQPVQPTEHGAVYPPNPPGPAYPHLAPTARPIPPAPDLPDPLTDFTVARPLRPAAPLQPSAPEPTPPYPAAPPYDPLQPASWPADLAAPGYPPPPVRSGRPVSITILSTLALLGAFFSIFQVVSPFPAFFFGETLRGWPLHLFGLVWTAALAIAGLGMLRLQRPAWLLSFALLALSTLNFLVLLLPGPRRRYVTYMAQLQQSASLGLPQPAVPHSLLTMSILTGIAFGLAAITVATLLLWRARWAFEPSAPPPAGSES